MQHSTKYTRETQEENLKFALSFVSPTPRVHLLELSGRVLGILLSSQGAGTFVWTIQRAFGT